MKLNRKMLRKLILKEILSEQIEAGLEENNSLVREIISAAEEAGVPKVNISADANPVGSDIDISIKGYGSDLAAKSAMDKILRLIPSRFHVEFKVQIVSPDITGNDFNIHFLISW